MIDVIINYLLIGWLFGFANVLLSFNNESNDSEQHYILSQTFVIILYWPIMAITILSYFAVKIIDQIKNFRKK